VFGASEHLTLHLPAKQQPVGSPPFHRWISADAQLFAEFFRAGPDEYLIRFPGIGDFNISARHPFVKVHPVEGAIQDTLLHLYLNQVRPLQLSAGGSLVLHAGAVRLSGQAIALVGPSGRGKSSLCASFAASGVPFLTDDGLELCLQDGLYFAQPHVPTVRLWEDSLTAIVGSSATEVLPVSYSAKTRVLASADLLHCEQALPLSHVFLLGAGEATRTEIRPLSAREAITLLIGNTYVLDIQDPETMAKHFDHITGLVSKLPCFMLDYPRRYELLPEVRQTLVNMVRSEKECPL